MVSGLEDWMLEHNQRVEVIPRQGTEGVTASLISKADCFWCFCFLGLTICTASGCLVGFTGWMSLLWLADHDWHGWHKSLHHLPKPENLLLLLKIHLFSATVRTHSSYISQVSCAVRNPCRSFRDGVFLWLQFWSPGKKVHRTSTWLFLPR